MNDTQRKMCDDITKRLSDEGRLIEAGWMLLRFMSLPPEAPAIQIQEMRKAFFAGAQHLFGSIMSILEPGTEPTEKDMQRITLINRELETFVKQMKAERN